MTMRPRDRRPPLPPLVLVGALLLAGCASGSDDDQASPAGTGAETSAETPAPTEAGSSIQASFVDPAGAELGTVDISFDGDRTVFTVEASGLEPGFHGFHVHETGACEPDSASPSDPAMTGDFLSAGGHLAEGDQVHGEHIGDLPALLAADDGTAELTVSTDRMGEADLLDADGSAVMVHAMPDNSGNIPERYAPEGTDEMTDNTGDAGGRVACAPLTADG